MKLGFSKGFDELLVLCNYVFAKAKLKINYVVYVCELCMVTIYFIQL